MHINELTATFGRLENETLVLEPGLNVIQAPNEAGKSTWTAFLRVMLFGLNTRDRSPAAEKRRYPPWSGSPMQGRMDLSTHLGNISIIRRTARSNSPMGVFSANYTGTSTPVPHLTTSNCGESLLGVPQEVYERSAYIRQSGIAVDQNATLERRIAALITTGEEDTSYTAAAEQLKKQLTRRRYNKSGLLPKLEQDILATQEALREINDLNHSARQAEVRHLQLRDAQEQLNLQLTLHDAADAAQQAAQTQAAKAEWESASLQAQKLATAAQSLPARQELEALRGAIDALAPLFTSQESAEQVVSDAEVQLTQAEAALAAHPLGKYSLQDAAALPLSDGQRPQRISLYALFLILAAGIALAAGIVAGGGGWLPAIGGGLGLFGAATITVSYPRIKKQQRWDEYHTQLQQQRQEELATLTALYDKVSQARADVQRAAATRDAVRAGYEANLRQVLARAAALHPGIRDTDTARAAAEEAIELLGTLEQAKQNADNARKRWEFLAERAPEISPEFVERPARSRQQIQEELGETQQQIAYLQQQIHTLQGRIQALGDPIALQEKLEQLSTQHHHLQAEYDAITLAMDTLSSANTELQNRFSPALGEKAAGIFAKLTRQKYDKVLLSRSMLPSAQESGQPLPREISLLSQGAADQLYLAVRLAICQLVLPEEQAAPILLDDALVTFDDERCAAALDYLTELAQERQILLFTCHSRELDYLSRAHPGKFHAIHLNP